MLTIFTNANVPRSGISSIPGQDRFRELLRYRVKTVQDYYRSNVRAVNSSSGFVQALKHLPSWTTDPIELSNTAKGRYPYIAKALKFTSDFNRGTLKTHKLNGASDTIVYATDEYVRPYSAVSEWDRQTPLKYLWIDSKGLDLFPALSPSEFNGLCSVQIDLPLAALMYKGFKESMMNSSSVLGEEHFVAIHLLTSSLPSQVDMSCISSIIARYRGEYTPVRQKVTSIYLGSYDDDFKKIADYVINRVEGTRMPYLQVLQNIPCIYKDNAHQALILPDHLSTTQVNWAMLLMRMPVINFLLDIGGNAGRKANQGFINRLKQHAKEVRLSRVPYMEMTDETAAFFDRSITRYERL